MNACRHNLTQHSVLHKNMTGRARVYIEGLSKFLQADKNRVSKDYIKTNIFTYKTYHFYIKYI